MQHAISPQPETHYFADDGCLPNSRLPVLVYRSVFPAAPSDPAAWFEHRFTTHNWRGTWRNGILSYHHYHSTSHEVLGIYRGFVTLLIGGEQGERLIAATGDVLVIPAGVGHKNLVQSPDLGVVGAYPDGRSWDLLRGEPGERPRADETIARLPLPDTDPLYGSTGPLRALWH